MKRKLGSFTSKAGNNGRCQYQKSQYAVHAHTAQTVMTRAPQFFIRASSRVLGSGSKSYGMCAGGSAEATRDEIANSSTGGFGPVYGTNRVGPSFLYSFGPINKLMPNETYNVTLLFAELYWSRPGQRLFNVSANNQSRLTDFDIFKAAGNSLCQPCLRIVLVPRV